MLRVASFFFWSHRSHFQKFASAPGFINDRAANRSASRSSRPDQNHHYHDQMVLRGKRPPFLTSSPTATRREDFVGPLGRDKFRNGQPYSQNDVFRFGNGYRHFTSRRVDQRPYHDAKRHFQKTPPNAVGIGPSSCPNELGSTPTRWGESDELGVGGLIESIMDR